MNDPRQLLSLFKIFLAFYQLFFDILYFYFEFVKTLTFDDWIIFKLIYN